MCLLWLAPTVQEIRDSEGEPPIEQMIIEQREAGWKNVSAHIYRTPGGAYFRGPYAAWCALTGRKMRRGW